MKRSFRMAAALAVLLVIAACTNSGVDSSALMPLRAEQAAAIAPPPPGSGIAASASSAQVQATELPQSAAPQGTLPGSAPQTPAPPMQAAAVSTPARIQFAPAVGAAPDAVAPLAARLSARAAQRGIPVAQPGDAATTHVLRGYFSAFTEQNQTVVIYVWDVLDPAGNRLHRIQGQQRAAGTSGEGWSSVAPPTMEAIADRTIDDLAIWLGSRSG